MCIIDEDIKVTDLPIFDFIALFIAMRSKSVDNIATLKYTYDWVDDDGEERQSELVINIDLDTIDLVFDEENAFDVIDVGSELSIKLKYPSIGFISTLPTDEELVCECIEYIYDAEAVYNDFSKEELKAFVEELDVKSILKIQEFMNNAPRIEHVEHVILNDGQKMDIVFNSLTDFFM